MVFMHVIQMVSAEHGHGTQAAPVEVLNVWAILLEDGGVHEHDLHQAVRSGVAIQRRNVLESCIVGKTDNTTTWDLEPIFVVREHQTNLQAMRWPC